MWDMVLLRRLAGLCQVPPGKRRYAAIPGQGKAGHEPFHSVQPEPSDPEANHFLLNPNYFVTKIDAGAAVSTVELELPPSAPVPEVIGSVEMLFAAWSASSKNLEAGSKTRNEGVADAVNGELVICVGAPVTESRAYAEILPAPRLVT